jgi:hypothetical protein
MIVTPHLHLPSRATLGAVSLGAATTASIAALYVGVDASVPDAVRPEAPGPPPVTDTEAWTEWEVRCMRVPARHPHDGPRNCMVTHASRNHAPVTPGFSP